MRRFIITWQSKKDKLTRKNRVQVIKDSGDIGIDAKKALNLFTNTYGSLKYNDIITIQEVDENGDNIGEPIKPVETEEPVIMPSTVRV